MTAHNNKEIARHLLEAVRSIKYGSIEIVIHDSRVVQIERTEKTRFDHGRNNG